MIRATAIVRRPAVKAERVVYTAEFAVDAGFGEPGAVTVLGEMTSDTALPSQRMRRLSPFMSIDVKRARLG